MSNQSPITQKFTEIRVAGLTPLTTIDYPDHLSSVIYCQGCPWQCRYCHNPAMIVANIPAKFSWRYILNFMHTRKGLLEAVVFSGGEPLLQKDLPQAIAQIREMGFKIGIHTAGSIPQRFQEILTMVDWVGFDIKDLANSCDDITQVKHSGKKNWQSLAMLLDAQVEYQCRTTIHWQLIDEDRLIKLTQKLAAMGVINYAIQFARTTIMHDKKLGHSTKAADKIAYLQARLQNILPSIIFSS